MASSSPRHETNRPERGGLVFFDEARLAARDYWRNALAREIGPSNLPLDRSTRALTDRRTGTHEFTVSGAPWRHAQSLTQGKPGLLHLLLIAATATVLHRQTGAGVIVLGSPPRGETAEPNALPLVIEVTATQTFRALLSDARRIASQAYTHQQYPHSAIERDFGLSESSGRCPLFDVSVSCAGVHGAMTATAQDIAIRAIPTVDVLSLRIDYKPALFDAATIERFAWRIGTALTTGVADPTVTLGDIDLLSVTERSQLLGSWGRAPESLCTDLLHIAFRRQATAEPDRIAVECDERSLTFEELERRSDALALALARLGVRPEAVVGLCLAPSIARVVAVLGVLKAGGAFLPLDPDYPTERLAHMVRQAQPCVLIAGEGLRDRPGPVACAIIELDAAADAFAAGARPVPPLSPVHPDNLAYIIYTSGSTGAPKGVACHHRGLANLAAAQIRTFDVRRSSRVLQFASFGFDAAVSEIAMSLAAGATLVLTDRDRLFPGEVLHTFLSQKLISHVTLVPSVLDLLPDAPLPSLSTLAAAGEACPEHLVARWSKGRRFLNAYGPTEVTVCATMHRCDPGDPRPSIGGPMANMEAFVLDKRMQLVPPGTEGELWVGGVGVARGYLANPAATAERFVPHPFGAMPGARLYRTGDRARFRLDGTLDFLGRADTQVKLRGFRIELGEIESVLRRHPQVADTAVLCREDRPGSKRLIAYIESRPGALPDDALLRAHLKGCLPAHMLPEGFVILTALPRTAKGSIARNALPAPEASSGRGHEPALPPRDSIEFDLVHIWEHLLDYRPIGIRDDFFELGGHSFLAVRLLAEIRERFDSDLPLPTVLQKPTVEALAAEIRKRGDSPASWSPMVALREEGADAPLFCVHPAGGSVLCYADLSTALGPSQPVYALQALGLTEGQTPLSTIENMAAVYVESVLAMPPQDSYILCGWSAGGLIAYEMAQQLRARDLNVGLVVLFDCYAPCALDLRARPAADEVQQLLSLFGDHVDMNESDLRQLAGDARLAYVLERARRADLIPPGYRSEDARRLLDVFAAISAACEAYSPRPYTGPVLLFAAQKDIPDTVVNPRDPSHGWQALAGDAITVIPVNGSHVEMLRPPLVAEVARRLRTEIDQVG